MGKGSYLGGSTLIRGSGCHSPKAKTKVGAINLNAHLDKPKLPKNLRKRKIKATKRQVEAVTTQPTPRSAKASKPTSGAPRKGNGLTIPQMVERARKRVAAIESDLAKTRTRLSQLERELRVAIRQVDEAQALP